MSAIFRILKNKWITPPKDVKESYVGRNVIVTGATSGIGPEAVAKFAKLGASKVIVAARNLGKGEAVKADIESRIGTTNQLEVWELDLDSYDSVIAFANRANKLDHLDIVILNAGLRRAPFVQSKYGWEDDIQVNVLSTTLLAVLLLPKLRESKALTGKIPILEFVNSGLHQSAQIDPELIKGPNLLEAYNKPDTFKAGPSYARSKLFLMYATNKLAEEISSEEVIITSVCPGMVKTDLARDHYRIPGVKMLISFLGLFLLRSPEQGSRILVSGTTLGESAHGRFWQHDKIQPMGSSVAGEKNRKIGLRVWNEIIEALAKDVPMVRNVLKSIIKVV